MKQGSFPPQLGGTKSRTAREYALHSIDILLNAVKGD